MVGFPFFFVIVLSRVVILWIKWYPFYCFINILWVLYVLKGDTIIFEECIALGPWGGGTQLVVKDWIFMPDGFIKKITIGYGRVIDYITFQSDTQSSTIGTAGKIGCQNCDMVNDQHML